MTARDQMRRSQRDQRRRQRHPIHFVSERRNGERRSGFDRRQRVAGPYNT
jgi:hypothetical protein